MAFRKSAGDAAFRDFANEYAQIRDPNERRRLALAELDKSAFGWHHVRAVVVAGIGFFTDAYDLFAIGLVTAMLGVVYWHDAETSPGVIPSGADTAVKVAAAGGAVIGQIAFGALADLLGRKRMYGIELIIIIFATLNQALTADAPGLSLVGTLVFWRVLMGVGVGGDHPLSAIITSEFANTKWRGAMMSAVFAMQGLGQLTAAIVALAVTAGFRESLISVETVADCDGACGLAVDRMWRIIIGIGAFPGCIALYYRLTIPETPRYSFDVHRDVVQAGSDIKAYLRGVAHGRPDEVIRAQAREEAVWKLEVPDASFSDFLHHFGQWKHGRVLLGTAASWFFLDVAFHGITLNGPIILDNIGFGGGDNVYEVFYRIASGNLILVCAGAIPGYWITVATIDVLGRKPIQLLGFVILTGLFCIIGFGFDRIGSAGLFACFVLCQLFFNFGPNATTFVVPGECFPTRYRAVAHGISAAAGRAGAIVAQLLIGPLRTRGAAPGSADQSPWLGRVMQIFALFTFLGIFATLLVPETKGRTLEQTAGEVEWSRDFDHGALEQDKPFPDSGIGSPELTGREKTSV